MSKLNSASDAVESELRRISPGGIRTYEGKYREDPRGALRAQDALVVAPSCTEEASKIVGLCHRHRVAVIPFGGGTGLVGGQIPQGVPRPVVVSLERLNRIRSVSPLENAMIVEAGCILENIHAAASNSDRMFPLSLAAKGSCQIGGNLATNAGGVHVVRYGNARDLCLGLEVVLPKGQVWDGLTSLRKDNAGYDLKNLFIGSEGTLGIITAAALKLSRRPVETATALLGVGSPSAALELFGEFQERFGGLISAFELISGVGFEFQELTMPGFKWPLETRPDWMVLVELSSEVSMELEEMIVEAAGSAADRSIVTDGAFAASRRQQNEIWKLREAVPEANRRIGAVSTHDVSVPIGSVGEFLETADKKIGRIGDFRINCFGHLGDGNLHYNVFPPTADGSPATPELRSRIRDAVRGVVHDLGGSLSAEHGIGRIYKKELLDTADAEFLSMMLAIKRALDPEGIMNPGAVFALDDD